MGAVGAPPKLPLVCLTTPGKRSFSVSDCSVCPSTISQFTGTMIDTDWDGLAKTTQAAWLKSHAASEWEGIPVFEGDIFYHRAEKRHYIVSFDLQKGFRLENMISGGTSDQWYFDLLTRKGNLWSPPKDLAPEVLFRYHCRRATEAREEAILLPDSWNL